ncbi:MAG TPA: histidine kinase [Candidatus Polarisedimenticolia bacterium]|nr:histidine kinase [Candidatus Polarisedimenticolia bacterium]
MHPLLTRNRLGLYLLAWVPLTATSAYVLATRGALGWLQATALAVAVYLFYALLCLSAWYPCRATPLGRVSFIRLLLTHLIAAMLISFVWTQAGAAIFYAVLSPDKFGLIKRQFQPQVNAVFTVGVLLYLLSVAFHYVLIAMEGSRHAEAQAVESRVLARDAELKALKAQVNPHFLFNSLNSISALTSVDPAKAREMCILLAEFLRMTLGLGEKSAILLSEELVLLERFLAIEKVRFGARLRVEEAIQDESRFLLIPPLLLQPLVENAVMHGIANLPDGGTIRVASQCQDGRLSITIENTFDAESTSTRRGGLGLANVRRRLEGRYEKQSSMQVIADGDRFRVQLSLPAESGAPSK